MNQWRTIYVPEFFSNIIQLLHHRTLSFYSLVYASRLLCLTEQFSLFGIHVTFCVERSVKCHFPYCYLINYSVLLFIRQLLLIDKKSALVCYTHPEASTIKWGVWPANRARSSLGYDYSTLKQTIPVSLGIRQQRFTCPEGELRGQLTHSRKNMVKILSFLLSNPVVSKQAGALPPLCGSWQTAASITMGKSLDCFYVLKTVAAFLSASSCCQHLLFRDLWRLPVCSGFDMSIIWSGIPHFRANVR